MSWSNIVNNIKYSLARGKSIGFHKRYALHDEYGCIFKVKYIGPGLSWDFTYISIKDNKEHTIYIDEVASLKLFEIVSPGYMPGHTPERVDSIAVQETYKIADAKITQ